MSLLAAVTTAEPSAAYQTGRSLFGLAVCALSARRGFVKVERLQQATGQLPRGWSPTTWSGICFGSLVVGHVWLSSSAGKLSAAPASPVGPVLAGPDPRFTWGATDAAPEWSRSAPQVPAQPLAEPAAASTASAVGDADDVAEAPPTAPPPPVPAVVQTPPKPFSMNPRPAWPTEPAAPIAAAPAGPAPAWPTAPVPAPPVAETATTVVEPLAPVLEAPAPAVPAPVAAHEVAAHEVAAAPATVALPVTQHVLEDLPPVDGPTQADEVVVPPAVPRVVSMDVLPATSGRKRR